MYKFIVTLGYIFTTCLLMSCSSVNFEYPKNESTAFTDTKDTYYGKQLLNETDHYPANHSGFYLLRDGIDALSARLLMADRAERSIDAQYYLIKNDITGHAFITALLRAADRGVRVRLLLDDAEAANYDTALVGLDSHPNFEIRVFNPFANRTFRKLGALTSFSRVNRRMHNKSFIVDNQITLFGGRNIGGEYFGSREDATFYDLDVVAIGSIVNEMSNMFDQYWNHERAAPLPGFAKLPNEPANELQRIRSELDRSLEEISTSRYAEVVKEKYWDLVGLDKDIFTWAPYKLIYDSPDKAFKHKADKVPLITTPIRESLLAAKENIIIVSPYFVPRTRGVEALANLQNSGVDITVITNSQQSNNQTLVHSGYAPARRPLLKAGIKIYEVRPTSNENNDEDIDFSSAKATLHTKAYIVDSEVLFIGSFNFDPRSANINTELGVIINSPKLVAQLTKNLDNALKEKTYELSLNSYNGITWRAFDNGQEIILNKDPETTWWQRFKSGFFQVLPIKGQL